MSREEEIRSPWLCCVTLAHPVYALLQCQSAYPAPSRTSTWRTWTALAEVVSAWSATPAMSVATTRRLLLLLAAQIVRSTSPPTRPSR